MHAAVSLKIDSDTTILTLLRLPNVLDKLPFRFVDPRRAKIQGCGPG